MTGLRENADAVRDGTPRAEVYARLLHVQLDLREAGLEDAEDLLCDEVLDPLWGRISRGRVHPMDGLIRPGAPTPTPEEIEAARTPAGGWTRDTLASWGVGWPPPKGWKKELERRAALLVRAGGRRGSVLGS